MASMSRARTGDAVVRDAARHGRRALDGVEAIHRPGGRRHAPAAHDVADVAQAPGTEGHEVGVERHDHRRPGRSGTASRRPRRRPAASRAAAVPPDRVPLDASARPGRRRAAPGCCVPSVGDVTVPVRMRSPAPRDARCASSTEASASTSALPGADLSGAGDHLRAVRVVEAEHRAPARRRRSRRGWRDARDCPRPSSGGPGGSRRATPSPKPPSGIAVAKKSGSPGHDALRVASRTERCAPSAAACRPPSPASASDALISFRKSRRPIAGLADAGGLARELVLQELEELVAPGELLEAAPQRRPRCAARRSRMARQVRRGGR